MLLYRLQNYIITVCMVRYVTYGLAGRAIIPSSTGRVYSAMTISSVGHNHWWLFNLQKTIQDNTITLLNFRYIYISESHLTLLKAHVICPKRTSFISEKSIQKSIRRRWSKKLPLIIDDTTDRQDRI